MRGPWQRFLPLASNITIYTLQLQLVICWLEVVCLHDTTPKWAVLYILVHSLDRCLVLQYEVSDWTPGFSKHLVDVLDVEAVRTTTGLEMES